MKNVLLASTALIGAAALLASPAAAEVKISAFSQFHAAGLDQDAPTPAGAKDFDFSTNTEIHFSGSHELDNGLTFGFKVEVESSAGRDGDIDENEIWVSGSFGKVVFGSQDGAANNLMVQGSFVGVGFGQVGNPTFTGVTTILNSAPTSSDVDDSSDAIKITYYTPRFNGIQAAVSYAPDTQSPGSAFTTGDTDAGYEDFVELGLNYSGEFNGVGIDAGLVAVFAENNGPLNADRDGFGGGLMLSYQGFQIAGGYAQTDDDGVGGQEDTVFDAGVSYSTGPWRVALGAVWSEEDTGGDEFELYGVTIDYTVGPGLSVYGTVSGGTVEDGATGFDNDFTSYVTGIKASF